MSSQRTRTEARPDQAAADEPAARPASAATAGPAAEAAPADRDTIFALSSGAGRAGVAVVRVTGPAAGPALKALAGSLPLPRHARLVTFRDGAGDAIDRGLALWFPGPGSVTGEDVAELHVHGGRAVIAGVLDALAARDGLRPAEAGEFTRRAFDAGRLDLTQVEGLGDLLAAETAGQRRQALRQMDGALAVRTEAWRARLLRLQAHLEAALEFPDEDLPEDVGADAIPEIGALATELGAYLDDDHRGERLRDGLRVAILGAPNVGKSSLLNQLARRDVAIVAETAGTTRDVIEVHLDLGGWPVIVADTAGLRESPEAVEAEGVRRAQARAVEADVRVVVLDAQAWPAVDPATAALVDGHAIVVANKSDLVSVPADAQVAGKPVLAVSALRGSGIGALIAALAERADAGLSPGEAPVVTRARHRAALAACHAALGRAATATAAELVVEDVRLAARELGRITGRVDVEDLLDVVFRDFCIGK